MSRFSEKNRGVIKKVTLEIEYPNGAKKVRSFNPEKDNVEGVFWSDTVVNEMVAPYYDKESTGIGAFNVMEMWSPVSKEWDDCPSVLVKSGNQITPGCSLHKDLLVEVV